jgi:hypothetical protein
VALVALVLRPDGGGLAKTADELGIVVGGVFLVVKGGAVFAKGIGDLAQGCGRPASLGVLYPCALLAPIDVGVERFINQSVVDGVVHESDLNRRMPAPRDRRDREWAGRA